MAIGAQSLQAAANFGNTCVGLSAGKYLTGSRNTYVGYLAGRNGSSGSLNVGIGNQALGSTATNPLMSASNNIAFGNEAGQSLTSGHSNLIIGRSDGVASTAITADNLILIGRDIDPPSVSTDGQVVIGNSTYNTTSVLNASTSISLKIGSSTVMNAISSAVTCEPAVKSNRFQLSTGGGMIVNSSGYALDAPGSYHISGAYAGEVRRVPIPPNLLMSDNDGNSGAQGATISDAGVNDPHSAPSANKQYVLGSGMSSPNSEGYLYCGQNVLSAWKATTIYVSLYDKSAAAAKAEYITVVSRSFSHASGSGTTRHLALASNSTNAEKVFSTAFIPNGSNYMVCFVWFDSLSTVFTGGYVRIERQ